MLDRIQSHFSKSIEAKIAVADQLAEQISLAAEIMSQALIADRKILACGNGGSAADAQHFAAELVGRFERERPELPATALTTDSSMLTAIGNDYGFDQVFSKQVKGLANKSDVLLAISTSGNSVNVINAINAAHSREVRVIALLGKDGGKIAGLVTESDVNLCVPVERTSHIQESHITIIHCLCDLIDNIIFGELK